MPGGDRTGPMGMGPRTGRAAGYCSGAGVPGYANALAAGGFGMRLGWGGRGRRFCGGGRGFWNRTNEAAALRAGLEEIDKRLGELEAAKKREGKE